MPADFTAMGVLDVGTFDGFYAFLAEHRGARRVLAVDNEQYRVWVAARWGIELEGAAGFRVIHRLLNSRVEYRRMDAFALAELGERFDLVFCFGILHRVENPLGLLRVLRTVTAEGGAVLVETYGTAPIVARAAPGSTSIGSRSATSRSAAVTANILPPRLIEPAISLNPPPCSRQLADFLLLPICSGPVGAPGRRSAPGSHRSIRTRPSARVRPGDPLVVPRLDRLARSIRDTRTITDELEQRDVASAARHQAAEDRPASGILARPPVAASLARRVSPAALGD